MSRPSPLLALAALLPGPPALATPERQVQLRLSAPEPRLVGGVVERPLVTRTFTLRGTGGGMAALRSQLNRIYAQVEVRQPRDVRFSWQGGRWVARAQTGWKVDRATTEARLREALKRGSGQSALVVRLQAPARSVRWAEAQGLTHLGAGQTGFAGSPDFRVQNIRAGMGQIDGSWIPPGAEFNFNARIGRINRENGFVPGHVIAGSRLNLEVGGGLCQVSTTVFRAAHAAGLPFTERHAHSYQVAYYDPPGLDAAVYAPARNLRWRNDTAGPVLVQATWDAPRQTLRVDLFGRPDGRRVWVAAPRQTGVRLPPPPAFVPDGNVPRGEARRVDLPAPGSRVTVTRQVRYPDGRVVREETVSVYRPWRGAFAVNPRDPRVR